MRIVLAAGVTFSVGIAAARAETSVDPLLCKRQETVESIDSHQAVQKTQTWVLDLRADQPAAAVNPDGTRKLGYRRDVSKHGFVVYDMKTQKTRALHSQDGDYDCDVVSQDGEGNSVRWLGNDVVLAAGLYCSEFAARPYLANAKTGTFVGFLRLKTGTTSSSGVTPEAVYQVAHLDGVLWAISVFDHNSTLNQVVVVDTKTAKIRSTRELSSAAIAALPDCSAR